MPLSHNTWNANLWKKKSKHYTCYILKKNEYREEIQTFIAQSSSDKNSIENARETKFPQVPLSVTPGSQMCLLLILCAFIYAMYRSGRQNFKGQTQSEHSAA